MANIRETRLGQIICSYRMFITILSLANVSIMYAEKNAFFGAISYMRCSDNQTADPNEYYTNEGFVCYEWSNTVRSTLVGMVFIGYAISQVFSGWITKKVGLKITLITAQAIVCLTTLIIPFAAQAHWILLAIVRFITGVAQGFIWPYVQMIVAYWSPENERSLHLSIMNAGTCVGPFIAMIISGPLCDLNLPTAKLDYLNQGWSIYFYVLSSMGVIVIILDVVFLSSDPMDNKFVSVKEKNYIAQSKQGRPKQEKKNVHVPFKQIFTSVAFYGFCAGLTFSDVGLYATWTIIPDYMTETFNSSAASISVAVSVPYLANLVAILFSGALSSYLVSSGKLSKTMNTKMFQTIGCVGAAICLFPIPFIKPNQLTLAAVCLSIGFGFHGLILGGGSPLNCNDFAGIFAGIVFTLANVLSNAVGTTLNFLTDAIKDAAQGGETGWRNVLFVFAGNYLLSALLFGIMSRGELQIWAIVEEDVEIPDSNPPKGDEQEKEASS